MKNEATYQLQLDWLRKSLTFNNFIKPRKGKRNLLKFYTRFKMNPWNTSDY